MAKCQVNNNWGLLKRISLFFSCCSLYFFVAEIVILMGVLCSYVLTGMGTSEWTCKALVLLYSR